MKTENCRIDPLNISQRVNSRALLQQQNCSVIAHFGYVTVMMSIPQLQSFLIGGRASSMASDRLITWTVYYAHLIMTSWLVVGSQVKAKRGIASGILVTVAPWFSGIAFMAVRQGPFTY